MQQLSCSASAGDDDDRALGMAKPERGDERRAHVFGTRDDPRWVELERLQCGIDGQCVGNRAQYAELFADLWLITHVWLRRAFRHGSATVEALHRHVVAGFDDHLHGICCLADRFIEHSSWFAR